MRSVRHCADLMRLLAAHGADPRFVHEVDYIVDGRMRAKRAASQKGLAPTNGGR